MKLIKSILLANLTTFSIILPSNIYSSNQQKSRDAQIRAHDPAAINNIKKYHFSEITYCQNAYEAITGAGAIIILTEWQEFKDLDWTKASTLVHSKILVNMRTIVDPTVLNSLNFTWDNIGRSCLTQHI